MGRLGVEFDSESEAPARRKAQHPLALAAAGVMSLVVFAAAGRMLRGFHEGDRPASIPAPEGTPVSAAAVAESGALARGRLAFRVHCARCHGPEGRGDGPDAPALRPPPRDLTTAPWRTAATRDAVRRTVADGIPGTMMPALSGALSPGELDAVTDFVLSLAPGRAEGPRGTAERLRKAGFTPAPAVRPAPPLAVRGAGGEVVSLDRLRGKLILVVFWGTTCAPCLGELPELEALAERYRGLGLAIVPVCVDEADGAVARRVAAGCAPGLPVFTDPTGTAGPSFNVQALPAAALIAPDGVLLGHRVGALDWSDPKVDAMLRAGLVGPSPPGA